MRVVVVTLSCDIHADAVAWALGRLGVACDLWLPLDRRTKTIGARMDPDPDAASIFMLGDAEYSLDCCRSVWLRRKATGNIPQDLRAEDRVYLVQELAFFHHGFRALFAQGGLVANPPVFAEHAMLKAPQLLAAKAVGLTIPTTLFSNDVGKVRAFVNASPTRIVYKSHSPAAWQAGEGKIVGLHTSFIDRSDLEGLTDDQFNPGIFQRFIEKKYELRVSIFGRTCIAAKIENQDPVDWRTSKGMTLSPYALPEEVEKKLLALMAELHLVMGMIDLIVTPEGDYVFLEVNEQGQFLWVEDANPEIRVLEPFARFLASGDAAYRWRPQSGASIRFEDYMTSDHHHRFADDCRRHVREYGRTEPWVIPEESPSS